MNARERVFAAIDNKGPDKTPMDFGGTLMSGCTAGFLESIRKILGVLLPDDRDEDGEWVDEQIQEYLAVDLRYVPIEPPMVVMRDLYPKNYERVAAEREKTKVRAKKGIKTTAIKHDHPLADYTLELVKKLKPNLLSLPMYLNWQIDIAKKYREDGYATTFWVCGGFFEVGCLDRGYDIFAMDLAVNPDLVKTLFDLYLKEKLHQAETIIKPLAPYIDIFCFGDDLGLQTGPFMSPELFRRDIKSYFIEHYSKVHEVAPDSRIFHHSCGSVYEFVDDIIDMGVDILNPIQPKAAKMQPEQLKQKGKGRICYHGGIDLQELLPFGMPEQVKETALRTIEILGDGGGYICAPAHSLPEDVPVENILTLFECSK